MYAKDPNQAKIRIENMIFRFMFPNVEGFLTKKKLTTPCVRAPTKAGTRNPGIVAAMFVIPISKPNQS